MDNPAKLVKQARMNRSSRRAAPAATQMEEPRRISVQPASGHANYSALMRSHDRMNSRHISGNGGT